MKTKKLFVVILAAILAVGAVFALTACGGNTNTKSYQLTGSYSDNLAALGDGFEFVLNLNANGTAVLDRYNPSSYNHADAASNSGFTAGFMSGTWKDAVKDSVDCLQIKLAVVDSAGATSNDITAYAYDVAGSYSFDLNFPLVVGMSFTRTVTMSGGETKTYADANAFIQAKKRVFTAPASIVTFTDSANNGTAYVQEDGTLLVYGGYNQLIAGKWGKTTTDGVIAISAKIDGNVIEATMDGNKATFEYEHDLGYENMTTKYTFVCNDVSGLDDMSINDIYTCTINEEIPTMGTMAVTYSLEIVSETEYKLSCMLAAMTGTYAISGSKITLVEVASSGTMPSLVKGKLAWTLNDSNFTMTLVTAA